MIVKKLNIHIFIGLFVGLLLVNQSIRAILYYNFIGVFFIILLGIYSYKFILQKQILNIKLNNDDKVIFIVYIALIIYASLTLFETGWNNYIYILELIALFFLYIIGRTINIFSYKIIVSIILMIGFIQAIFLIYNRGYIYDSGVNYLLLSLTIGLYTCLSLLSYIFSKKKYHKIYFLVLFILGWISLFSMQSRAVFLVVGLYSILMPFIILSVKNKLKLIGFIFTVLMIGVFIYQNQIKEIYENTIIHERMYELFYNFENEPRFITYGLYFNNFEDFFITGYGINGTKLGIYTSTIEKYPHNFILEFISDFGILGFMFSVFFISRSFFILLVKTKNNFYSLSIFTIYMYYLINFMKSFSIYDSYVLFFAIGLVFNKKLRFS